MRNLLVTSPMMTGADVLGVQQRLAELGYEIGPSDGVYGTATMAAVKAFQSDHGIGDDGVVGPGTRDALAAANRPAQPAAPSPIGARALAEALKHIGVKEAPVDSNCTKFGEWFGENGVPWCNIFVSYCFSVGAGYTIVDGYAGGRGAGVYQGKGCAYVPTTEAWLRMTGMWIGHVAPQPGDIAIFNWDGGPPDHIGIVVKDLGNGSFETVEGNTSDGDSSDGGEVMRRVRNLTQVDGFGRIKA
jgi:cell wall-associated NlpC family hydrolase